MPDTYPAEFIPDYSVDADYEALKVPPNSIQAEQSVLGGLMLDNEAWQKIGDKVTDEDFYRHDHRLIFRSIRSLADANSPFDVITLSEELKKTGELEDVGGLGYLGTLAKETPSAANIEAYAAIVRERSVLRQLIHIGTEISDSAYQSEGRKSNELLGEAEQKVFRISEQLQLHGNGFKPLKDLLSGAVEQIEKLYSLEGSLAGLSTGFTDLDELTSGLQAPDLIIVAGRPSMGKTTFAMNVAESVAISANMPVAVFKCPASNWQCV